MLHGGRLDRALHRWVHPPGQHHPAPGPGPPAPGRADRPLRGPVPPGGSAARVQMFPEAEPAGLDAELERRGYDLVRPSLVRVLDPLPPAAARVPGRVRASGSAGASEAWLACAMVGGHAPWAGSRHLVPEPCYVLLEGPDGPAACALVVVEDGWAGISGVEVRADLRGRGLGRCVMEVVHARAAAMGAGGPTCWCRTTTGSPGSCTRPWGYRAAYRSWARGPARLALPDELRVEPQQLLVPLAPGHHPARLQVAVRAGDGAVLGQPRLGAVVDDGRLVLPELELGGLHQPGPVAPGGEQKSRSWLSRNDGRLSPGGGPGVRARTAWTSAPGGPARGRATSFLRISRNPKSRSPSNTPAYSRMIASATGSPRRAARQWRSLCGSRRVPRWSRRMPSNRASPTR